MLHPDGIITIRWKILNRRHTDEEREQDLRILLKSEKGMLTVSKVMGIRVNTLNRWVKDYKQKQGILEESRRLIMRVGAGLSDAHFGTVLSDFTGTVVPISMVQPRPTQLAIEERRIQTILVLRAFPLH